MYGGNLAAYEQLLAAESPQRSAGITRWLRLDRDAGLTAIEPP